MRCGIETTLSREDTMQKYESPSVKTHLINSFIQKMRNITDKYQYHLRYKQYPEAIADAKFMLHFIDSTVYQSHDIHPLSIIDTDPYLYLAYFSAKALVHFSEGKKT
jgi:hypothetical protein